MLQIGAGGLSSRRNSDREAAVRQRNLAAEPKLTILRFFVLRIYRGFLMLLVFELSKFTTKVPQTNLESNFVLFWGLISEERPVSPTLIPENPFASSGAKSSSRLVFLLFVYSVRKNLNRSSCHQRSNENYASLETNFAG